MRASPAFQVTIRRFGIWRVGVCVLMVAAAGGLIAWVSTRDDAAARYWLAAPAAALIAAAAKLLRCPAMSLRWDTQTWRMGPAATVGEEPWSGHLAVAVDLGAWMLLRFERDAAPGLRRIVWLPLQRRGLATRWHTLRCAVYSARPAAGRAERLPVAISPESQESTPLTPMPR
jgi:hypothetical protein